MNSTMFSEALTTWLYPLRPALDPADQIDWQRLRMLAGAMDETLVAHPVGADLSAGAERSHRLRAIRQELADRSLVDIAGQPAPFQVLAQFLCGYRDIDLRDAIGLGHGLLIARHGSPQARRKWIPRLLAGELAGIAVTEPHGGSRPVATRTRAVAGPDGTPRPQRLAVRRRHPRQLVPGCGQRHTAGDSTAVPAPLSRPESVPMTA